MTTMTSALRKDVSGRTAAHDPRTTAYPRSPAPWKAFDGVATFVLAGGEGKRLLPLTAAAPKPAVPFGAEGRIVDFALENCLHSGITSAAVLTQYRPQPLEEYLERRFAPRFRELGGALALVRGGSSTPLYPGTAAAIAAGLERLRGDLGTILVLAADHIYRMDYREFLAAHLASGADMTVGAVEVPLQEARRFGVFETDPSGRATAFAEKPATPTPLPGNPARALASMGIYLFRRQALVAARDLVGWSPSIDFGRDIVPAILKGGHVQIFRHGPGARDGEASALWFDVGTPEALISANLALHPRGAVMPSAVVAPGASVRRSVVRAGSFIGAGASVEDSFVLEGAVIEPGARVRRAVIGAGATVPAGQQVGPTADDPERVTVIMGGGRA